MDMTLINSIKASKVHKEIMNDLVENKIVKPGVSINDLVNYIENSVCEKIKYDALNPLKGGCGFPANISVNEVVAHYTSCSNETIYPSCSNETIYPSCSNETNGKSGHLNDYILKEDDIVKVDFGVHYEGSIIDSAQTFHFNPKFDDFIDISKKATNYAISLSGPDVNLGDLGGLIEEYVKSKEVEIDNKVFPLFTLKDLTGHNIAPYIIHKSKALPNTAIKYPIRMEEGDIFAVEPFVSTTDLCYYDDPVELYMINKNYTNMIKKLKKEELELFNKIFDKYFMLCFCKRWLNELKEFDKNVFTKLINKNIIEEYKTIYVKSGNYVSQFEHNIYIKSNGIVKLTENKYY